MADQFFKDAQLESVKAWLSSSEHSALPLHERIQRGFRKLMLDGALKVGRPLPASRRLAQSLGVSRDTVEAAYVQLEAEGFIERRVGSGSFVSEQVQPLRASASRRASVLPPVLRLSQRGDAIFNAGGLRDFSVPRAFAPGLPETRRFPLKVWERLQRQVLRDYGTRALLHSDPQGVEPLRQAIADYVNLERGAQATAERVLVLTSSQQALTLCANVLLDAGDAIFVEDPVYQGARRAFDAAGLDCLPVRVDADGMKIELLSSSKARSATRALAQSAKAVFLTPSHQFPTGATLSLERRLAAIEWARQSRAWIIEDDYDSEFHYEGRPTACVQGLDASERTIYIGTFSKSLFPGLRLAYMVLPSALVEPMTVARTLLDGHSAPLAQLTLARFIEAGHFGAHVRVMRSVYAEQRDVLEKLLRKHLSPFLDPRVPSGGMQMPCLFNRDISEAEAVAAAKQAGIDLLGLTALHASPNSPSEWKPGFLLGFAAYTPAELSTAAKQLVKVLRGVSGPPFAG